MRLEKNIGSKLLDISHGKNFLDMFPQARETKTKKNLLEIHQNKQLLHSQGNHQQNKKATTKWGKIFANDISNKRLISKIYEEFMHSKKKEFMHSTHIHKQSD